MWTRAELKEKAKMAFKRNYWSCVLVAFVLGLVLAGGSSSPSLQIRIPFNIGNLGNSFVADDFSKDDFYYEDDFFEDDFYEDEDVYYESFPSELIGLGFVILTVIGVILLIALVIGLALRIFVFAPMEVGGCRFFVANSFEKSSAGLMFYGFSNGHYKNVIYTMFLRDLYTFLWSLLFVIPGIVKSYEYRMVPYLLADCPDMPKEDAFAISKELMMGNKWATFVLDLSFIGWHILNTFTCGILGIFWINPYVQATNAELFLTLKKNYFSGQNTFQGAEF